VLGAVVSGLVRSDEMPEKHHPVDRPGFGPPTHVRGDRRDEGVVMTSSASRDSHQRSSTAEAPAKSVGAEAALARGEIRVSRAVDWGLARRGLTRGVCRLSGRLVGVAVVIARHATQSFTNWTPSL
jgi:hypothetical protein